MNRLLIKLFLLPLLLIEPLAAVVTVLGIITIPEAGIVLAIWFAVIFGTTLKNPPGSSGNCAGAFGFMSAIVVSVVGAVVCVVATLIGMIAHSVLS